MLALLLAAQAVALVVLCRRLARGRRRIAPVPPPRGDPPRTSVSVVIPTRNEAQRLGACLGALRREGPPLVEVIVVDGESTDGTVDLVHESARRDPRVRLLTEPPRAPGSVGRPWAIAAGCRVASGEWILGLDADVVPRAGMIAGTVVAAEANQLDVVSFAPTLVAHGSAARWLQSAFLATLVYRFGPAGVRGVPPARAVANGQCLLMRRASLEHAGGYGVVRESLCDDVSIVRHLAARGARVGFLDGRRLLRVQMYRSAAETWRAWPPSLGMRDATAIGWRWLDALFLVLAQAAPIPVLMLLAAGLVAEPASLALGLAVVNAALLSLRALLLVAAAGSFERRGWGYWLSPLADPVVVPRVIQMMAHRPQEWRGRGRSADCALRTAD